MFNFSHAWTIVLRSFYANRRDFNKLMEFTYWPLIDITLFGFIGVQFASTTNQAETFSLMAAMLLWQVVYRTNFEISRNALQEIRDNNLINFLTTPLRIIELILGWMLIGFLSLFFAVPFGAAVIYFMYGINTFSLGISLFLFIFLLMFSGWILGLLGASILIYGGQRVDTVIWAIGWLSAPLCGVFYPLDILPRWAQIIGKCFPMTYVFESMRILVKSGTLPVYNISVCVILTLFYFCLAFCFFNYMLNKSKNRGLSNL